MHRQQAIIANLDFTIVQPTTPEEVEFLWPDFLEISKNFPHLFGRDFYVWIKQNPKVLIQFYISGIAAGWILRELNTTGDAAEIQGCIRKSLIPLLHQHKAQDKNVDTKTIKRWFHKATNEVERRVIEETFFKLHRKAIVIQFRDDNRALKGFAWKWGFKPAGRNNSNNLVYLLTQQSYLEQRNKLFPEHASKQ